MSKPARPTLEELKRTVDLASLVRSYGVELKNHGKNLVGKCPFHEDKTPSFVVTPTKNLWHCMGACQTGGSAIDFVMKKEGVRIREAILILRKKQHTTTIERKKQTPPKETEERQTLEKETDRKHFQDFSEPEQDLIERVFEYYQETLNNNKTAKEYLKTRGSKGTWLHHDVFVFGEFLEFCDPKKGPLFQRSGRVLEMFFLE